jgi:rhamnulokinase
MTLQNFLAVDLGAESGRVIVGCFGADRLTLREAHRFRNPPLERMGHLHWDATRLFEEIRIGMRRAADQIGEAASLGIDTWGVDFALLDRDGKLSQNPYTYRDRRTDGITEKVFTRISDKELFHITGIQSMQINTLMQLYALWTNDPGAVENSSALLMMPDLFHYWLTGEKKCEYTISSTSQMVNIQTQNWDAEIFMRLGIPPHFLQPIVPPCSILGPLRPEIAGETGLKNLQIIAPACHDTASAVAAVPAEGKNFAYISCGTWSLMGTVETQPVRSEQAQTMGFTNEGGVDNSYRLLKNITGLWIFQECRRSWSQSGEALEYAQMEKMAGNGLPFQAVINPDHPSFLHPEDMPEAIRHFCTVTDQAVPSSREQILRVVLESLALKYRETLDQLEEITGRRMAVLHIVGGGSQNALLCRFTADSCNRPVVAGPVEATAIGNILSQMVAGQACNTWEEARKIVRSSFPVTPYSPQHAEQWQEAYHRYMKMRRVFP